MGLNSAGMLSFDQCHNFSQLEPIIICDKSRWCAPDNEQLDSF